MGRDENSSIGFENGDWEFPAAGDLGNLLKHQREKLGLSLDQLSEQIRVRSRFLAAMEKEQWDRLPSYGFVKGFMRAYAQALELEPDKVLSLYETLAFSPDTSVQGLTSEPSGRKRTLTVAVIILIFLVLAAGGLYYAWKIYAPQKPGMTDKGPNEPIAEEIPVQEDGREVVGEESPRVEKPERETPPEPAPEVIPPPEQKPVAVPQEVSPSLESPEAAIPPSPAEPPAHSSETAQATDTGREKEPEGAAQNGPPHVLKAIVRERTWIRIFIDEQEPKEYVFEPGSRPQWEAAEGFELLIGNAGGIDFEFNGKRMADLGEPGKVIRLSFPEAFQQNRTEE